VTRVGIIGQEPLIVAIGATVLSDTLSSLVFTVSISTYAKGFSPWHQSAHRKRQRPARPACSR